MAQSNQPFKRPNLSEKEEYQRIPPPERQKGGNKGQNNGQPNDTVNPSGAQTPMPPTQEEIDWAIQVEESVQKRGYQPTETEMARYQDIANRIVLFQQAQAQAQKFVPQRPQIITVAPQKSFFWKFIKFSFWTIMALLFWAKASIVVLQPSYFTPRGKVYLVIKPVNFSTVYYSVNMDKVYDEKLRKGFNKNDLNLESSAKKKKSKKVNPNWYIDPQYWEDNYIMSFPYPSFKYL